MSFQFPISRWGMLPCLAQSLGGRSLASFSHFPFNGSIKLLQNLHSRGSMKQHFYVWEPRCGYLLKVKKVSWCPLTEGGHRLAIILENVLVPPTPILLFLFVIPFICWQINTYLLTYIITSKLGTIFMSSTAPIHAHQTFPEARLVASPSLNCSST